VSGVVVMLVVLHPLVEVALLRLGGLVLLLAEEDAAALLLAPALPGVVIFERRTETRVARWFVSKPKIPIWVNFVGSCYGNFCILYDRLVYFTAIGYNLWPFGIFCGNLVYFPPFWYFGPRKNWQP
jgi:hypothetical protein